MNFWFDMFCSELLRLANTAEFYSEPPYALFWYAGAIYMKDRDLYKEYDIANWLHAIRDEYKLYTEGKL